MCKDHAHWTVLIYELEIYVIGVGPLGENKMSRQGVIRVRKTAKSSHFVNQLLCKFKLNVT